MAQNLIWGFNLNKYLCLIADFHIDEQKDFFTESFLENNNNRKVDLLLKLQVKNKIIKVILKKYKNKLYFETDYNFNQKQLNMYCGIGFTVNDFDIIKDKRLIKNGIIYNIGLIKCKNPDDRIPKLKDNK